jgi:hypothetical protein
LIQEKGEGTHAAAHDHAHPGRDSHSAKMASQMRTQAVEGAPHLLMPSDRQRLSTS